MKKTLLLFWITLIFFSCSSRKEQLQGQNPASVEFEILRTQSPLTHEVPSHLKYEALPSYMGGKFLNKTSKIYPNSWEAVDDQFATLSVTMIDADPLNPEIMYFCTGEGWGNADAARGAGVWKSTDAGNNWIQLPATKSADFYYCQDLRVHPFNSDLYVTTRDGGVMRSQDGGQNWESVLNANSGSLRSSAADIEFSSTGDIYVSIGMRETDGIYFSSTGNTGSWSKRMNGIPTAVRRIELATAQSDSNVVYAIAERASANTDSIEGVYRSEDKGLNWTTLALPGNNRKMANIQAWYDLIVEVDPNNADIVVVGGLNIWRSTNAGNSWQQLTEGDRRRKSDLPNVHVDQHGIFFKNSDTVYFTNDGGIYRSCNFSEPEPAFENMNQNYNVTQYYAGDIDPRKDGILLVGGTQDNGSNVATSEGISNFDQVSWADGSYCAIDHEDQKYWYTTTQYRRMFRTYGNVQDTITNPNIVDNNTLFINPIHMDVNNPELIYQATNVGLWRLSSARTANRNNWQKCTRNFGIITAISSSKSNPNLVCIGRFVGSATNAIPYRIDNAHITDENTIPLSMDKDNQLPRGGYLNCITIDPTDANHMLLIYTNYDVESVYESWNALDNDPDWISIEGNLPNFPIRWASFHPEKPYVAYLATEMGVYYTDSINGDSTVWVKTNSSLPNLRMDMIKYRESDHTFMVASHGRGFFTGHLEEGSNDILWEERGPSNIGGRTRTILIDPNVPSGRKVWAGSVSGGLWVAQNIDSVSSFIELRPKVEFGIHPNPASDYVWIYLSPNSDGSAVVRIYDRLGKLIQEDTLEYSSEPIRYSVSSLATGYYFFSLLQEENKSVRKILITP